MTRLTYPIDGVRSKFINRYQWLARSSRGVRDSLPSTAHFWLRVAPFDRHVDGVVDMEPPQACRIPFPFQRHWSVANRSCNWNRCRDPTHASCQENCCSISQHPNEPSVRYWIYKENVTASLSFGLRLYTILFIMLKPTFWFSVLLFQTWWRTEITQHFWIYILNALILLHLSLYISYITFDFIDIGRDSQVASL